MTLALELLPLGVCAFLAWSYRRRFLLAIKQRDDAEAKGSAMLSRCNRLEAALPSSLAHLSNAQVARLYQGIKHGFPDEFPAHHPLGTPSNPVLTVNGDSAWYSELDAFCPRVIP